jgi:hypothetical protein
MDYSMTNLAKLSHSTEMISRRSWFAARGVVVVVCCIYNESEIHIGPQVGFIVQRVLSQLEGALSSLHRLLQLTLSYDFRE